MNWIQLVWPMLASACLTAGLAHAVVWSARPAQRAHLAFALAAMSVAALALLELRAYRTLSPAEIASCLRWMHVAITVMVLALLYALHHWFGYGSARIAIAAAALRVMALVINFTVGENLSFLAITDVGRSTWWGVQISHPIGDANPWVALAQISNALVLVYIGQTVLHALRKPTPESRAAVVVGGSWFLLIGIMIASAILMTLGLPRPPLIAAPGFVIVVVATSYCLVSELVRSHRMEMDLRESELRRLRSEQEVATERANLAHLSRVTTLGEMSSSLVHELNQPLAAILSNAQAAQRILRRDPPDTLEIQEILSDIVDNDRRAGEVIGRMRGFVRKEVREPAPLLVNDVVQDCLRLMRSELLDQHVTMRLELASGLPSCLGDRVQLQQVLLNLIMNACEAMPRSSGERIVRVRTTPSPDGVLTEVIDAGDGIPEAMLERMFTPFETTKATGMGMGLAVCRTIIQAHGGRIWAENVTPQGARVCFDLPRRG